MLFVLLGKPGTYLADLHIGIKSLLVDVAMMSCIISLCMGDFELHMLSNTYVTSHIKGGFIELNNYCSIFPLVNVYFSDFILSRRVHLL